MGTVPSLSMNTVLFNSWRDNVTGKLELVSDKRRATFTWFAGIQVEHSLCLTGAVTLYFLCP